MSEYDSLSILELQDLKLINLHANINSAIITFSCKHSTQSLIYFVQSNGHVVVFNYQTHTIEREFNIPNVGKVSGLVREVIDEEFIYLNAKCSECIDEEFDDEFKICKFNLRSDELIWYDVVHEMLNFDYLQMLYWKGCIYVYGNTFKHYDSTLCRFDFEKFEVLNMNEGNEFPDSHLMVVKDDVLIGFGSTSGTFQCYYSGLLDRDVWFCDISKEATRFEKIQLSEMESDTVMNGEFLSFCLEGKDDVMCLFIGGYDDLYQIDYSMEVMNVSKFSSSLTPPKCGTTKFYLKPYSDLFEILQKAPIQSRVIQYIEKKYCRALLTVEGSLYYLDVVFDEYYYYCKLFPNYFTNRFSDLEIICE